MDTMHLLPSVAIQPNLELKTWPKQLLGSLPLVIVLPKLTQQYWQVTNTLTYYKKILIHQKFILTFGQVPIL